MRTTTRAFLAVLPPLFVTLYQNLSLMSRPEYLGTLHIQRLLSGNSISEPAVSSRNEELWHKDSRASAEHH